MVRLQGLSGVLFILGNEHHSTVDAHPAIVMSLLLVPPRLLLYNNVIVWLWPTAIVSNRLSVVTYSSTIKEVICLSETNNAFPTMGLVWGVLANVEEHLEGILHFFQRAHICV